jgi:predicted nucleic acid-binding Zn ribbon protein
MDREIERIGEVLRRVVKDGALAQGLREQEALTRWPEIVGALNGRHSRALGLRDGVLWVQVESSVWAQELTFLRPQIQRALDRELGPGSVREVRFHSGSLPEGRTG